MKIHFWGVRGSIAAPLTGEEIRQKAKEALLYAAPTDILNEESIDRFLDSLPPSLLGTHGGNTPCIELRSQKEDLIIIDGGSGMSALSRKLMNEKNGGFAAGQGEGHLILTHTHWDHIQGIPFFEPLYIPGNMFHFHSVIERLEERLRDQQNNRFFPVTMDAMAAVKKFHQRRRDEKWRLGDINISQIAVPHPGGCYAYRFEEYGQVFVFCCDAEFKAESFDLAKNHLEFLKEADLLVFDAHYTKEEKPRKTDWGHSSAHTAVEIAVKSGVKKLILFHHNPHYNDRQLEESYIKALQYKSRLTKKSGSELELLMAREGLQVEI